MKLQDALNLHNKNEVTVKKTKQVMKVIKTVVVPKEHTFKNMTRVDILLEDGNWYEHREIM